MNISDKGIKIICESETFKAKPYLCPAGIPTIGYGSTCYENGTKVTLKNTPITEQRAIAMLKCHIDKIVAPTIKKLIKTELNQNQYDALCSFIYNVGDGNFKSSTLLKKVNANRFDPTIQNEFMKWVHAGGKVLKGLVTRRMKEGNLYFGT